MVDWWIEGFQAHTFTDYEMHLFSVTLPYELHATSCRRSACGCMRMQCNRLQLAAANPRTCDQRRRCHTKRGDPHLRAQLVQHIPLVRKLRQPLLLCGCGMLLSLNITLQATNSSLQDNMCFR